MLSEQYWFRDMEIEDGELLVGTEEGSRLVKLSDKKKKKILRFPKILKPVYKETNLRQPSPAGCLENPGQFSGLPLGGTGIICQADFSAVARGKRLEDVCTPT